MFLYILLQFRTSMDEIMDSIRREQIKQSLVIALGVSGNINQTFVVVEGDVLEAKCLVSAVDKCFKLHYIGQLEYDPLVNNVWQFIQVHYYGIRDNIQIFECVRDLITYLKAR